MDVITASLSVPVNNKADFMLWLYRAIEMQEQDANLELKAAPLDATTKSSSNNSSIMWAVDGHAFVIPDPILFAKEHLLENYGAKQSPLEKRKKDVLIQDALVSFLSALQRFGFVRTTTRALDLEYSGCTDVQTFFVQLYGPRAWEFSHPDFYFGCECQMSQRDHISEDCSQCEANLSRSREILPWEATIRELSSQVGTLTDIQCQTSEIVMNLVKKTDQLRYQYRQIHHIRSAWKHYSDNKDPVLNYADSLTHSSSTGVASLGMENKRRKYLNSPTQSRTCADELKRSQAAVLGPQGFDHDTSEKCIPTLCSLFKSSATSTVTAEEKQGTKHFMCKPVYGNDLLCKYFGACPLPCSKLCFIDTNAPYETDISSSKGNFYAIDIEDAAKRLGSVKRKAANK
jgi:hypothetical protein